MNEADRRRWEKDWVQSGPYRWERRLHEPDPESLHLESDEPEVLEEADDGERQ